MSQQLFQLPQCFHLDSQTEVSKTIKAISISQTY